MLSPLLDMGTRLKCEMNVKKPRGRNGGRPCKFEGGLIVVPVSIRADQAEWLKKQPNKSEAVRVALDLAIKADTLNKNKLVIKMKISELIENLKIFSEKYGDVKVVLFDLDTSLYFSLKSENIEAQRIENGDIRVSIGLNCWSEKNEKYSVVERPL